MKIIQLIFLDILAENLGDTLKVAKNVRKGNLIPQTYLPAHLNILARPFFFVPKATFLIAQKQKVLNFLML